MLYYYSHFYIKVVYFVLSYLHFAGSGRDRLWMRLLPHVTWPTVPEHWREVCRENHTLVSECVFDSWLDWWRKGLAFSVLVHRHHLNYCLWNSTLCQLSVRFCWKWLVCLMTFCRGEQADLDAGWRNKCELFVCSLWVKLCSVRSHARTVVRECCKGDDESQWEMGKFDPPPPKNPLTDGH